MFDKKRNEFLPLDFLNKYHLNYSILFVCYFWMNLRIEKKDEISWEIIYNKSNYTNYIFSN